MLNLLRYKGRDALKKIATRPSRSRRGLRPVAGIFALLVVPKEIQMTRGCSGRLNGFHTVVDCDATQHLTQARS